MRQTPPALRLRPFRPSRPPAEGRFRFSGDVGTDGRTSARRSRPRRRIVGTAILTGPVSSNSAPSQSPDNGEESERKACPSGKFPLPDTRPAYHMPRKSILTACFSRRRGRTAETPGQSPVPESVVSVQRNRAPPRFPADCPITRRNLSGFLPAGKIRGQKCVSVG